MLRSETTREPPEIWVLSDPLRVLFKNSLWTEEELDNSQVDWPPMQREICSFCSILFFLGLANFVKTEECKLVWDGQNTCYRKAKLKERDNAVDGMILRYHGTQRLSDLMLELHDELEFANEDEDDEDEYCQAPAGVKGTKKSVAQPKVQATCFTPAAGDGKVANSGTNVIPFRRRE